MNRPIRLMPHILTQVSESSNTLILETERGVSSLDIGDIEHIQIILETFLVFMEIKDKKKVELSLEEVQEIKE